MSNYLEHLECSRSVIDQLAVVRRVLKPGGRVMILQPNIRLVGARYWDFIDHRSRSQSEAWSKPQLSPASPRRS